LDTTVNIEFTSDIAQHLKMLEQQLKRIHDVKVDLVVPKDISVAPALIAISLSDNLVKAERAAHNVAQTLHSFLHEDEEVQTQKKIYLVTKEGDRIDIEPLSAEEIERIIVDAKEEE
jgi:hypothetical protein